jgi:hypothetical protein
VLCARLSYQAWLDGRVSALVAGMQQAGAMCIIEPGKRFTKLLSQLLLLLSIVRTATAATVASVSVTAYAITLSHSVTYLSKSDLLFMQAHGSSPHLYVVLVTMSNALMLMFDVHIVVADCVI